MRDGISAAELEKIVHDLARGAPWDVAVKALAGVDPKVIAVNKDSILRLAGVEAAKPVAIPVKGDAPKDEKKSKKVEPDPLA